MKVFIGSDHGGYDLKGSLITSLMERGFDIVDRGTNSKKSCDYPDFSFAVAEDVRTNPGSFGVLVCTTGVGASMCANKVKGIRAALCINKDQAIMSRRHNDANVIVFGAKYTSPEEALEMFMAWVNEPFEGGRHQRRVDKINERG
ncbi:MAG: ribose 5-phosphate isomerase B [Candidatus Omnitrophica bacterium]|nr:ribose 5-phosphate isomerase B [Candidatus Omnitrophota bacterium]